MALTNRRPLNSEPRRATAPRLSLIDGPYSRAGRLDGGSTNFASIGPLPDSFFRSLAEAVGGGLWLIDFNGQTTLVNSRMEDLLAVPASEILGRNPGYFLVTEDIPEASDVIRSTLAGDSRRFEVRFRRPDGRHVRLVGQSAPFRDPDGEISGALATFVEVGVDAEPG